MLHKRLGIALSVLVLVSLVLGACGPTPAPTEPPKPTEAPKPTDTPKPTEAPTPTEAPKAEGVIKVGMMTVMTGPAASVGMEQRNWAKLAMDQFNEAGGVDGVQVEMVEGDTEFDPAKSVLLAEQMAADADVYGLVGPESSQNCAATAEIFEENSLVYISPSCTKPDLSEQGYKTFFRMVPRDDVQAPGDAVFIAEDLGAKSVYIIDDQTVYSVGIADEAEKKLQELGVTEIERESITQEDSDFLALPMRVWAAEPDVIFLPIQLAAQGAQIAKQMQEWGVEAEIVGSDGQFSPDDFIAGAEGATEGAYVSQFAPDVHYLPEAEAAWKAYEEQYGSFGAYGPPAYESMAILLDAIKRAYEKDGEVTREGVVREVAATKDRPGILGFNVSFNEKGDAVGAAFYIFQVVGDHFELVKKMEEVPTAVALPALEGPITDFELLYTLQDIDQTVLSLFKAKLQGTQIANPNEPFQVTDEVIAGQDLPARRLIVAGKAPDMWFIFYEHGGYAYHHHLVVFSSSDGSWKISHAGQGWVSDIGPETVFDQNALAGLQTAIEEGGFHRSDHY